MSADIAAYVFILYLVSDWLLLKRGYTSLAHGDDLFKRVSVPLDLNYKKLYSYGRLSWSALIQHAGRAEQAFLSCYETQVFHTENEWHWSWRPMTWLNCMSERRRVEMPADAVRKMCEHMSHFWLKAMLAYDSHVCPHSTDLRSEMKIIKTSEQLFLRNGRATTFWPVKHACAPHHISKLSASKPSFKSLRTVISCAMLTDEKHPSQECHMSCNACFLSKLCKNALWSHNAQVDAWV